MWSSCSLLSSQKVRSPPPLRYTTPPKKPRPHGSDFLLICWKVFSLADLSGSDGLSHIWRSHALHLSPPIKQWPLSLSFSFSRVFRADCMRRHGEGLSQQVRDWPHVPDSRFPLRSSRKRTGRSSRNPSHFSHGAAIDSLRSFICRNPLTNW